MVSVPGQCQSISAASAVSAKGAFWFATYAGGLNGTLFVTLLRRMMRGRRKPLHLIVDGLPGTSKNESAGDPLALDARVSWFPRGWLAPSTFFRPLDALVGAGGRP